jgi:Terminase small subunit.
MRGRQRRKRGINRRRKTGWRLLYNPEIAELVNERLKEMGATADEVLVRLTNQARAGLGDFLTVDANGKATLDWAAIKRAGDVVKKNLVHATWNTCSGIVR